MTVTLNPAAAADLDGGRFVVTRFPGGWWAVKVRQHPDTGMWVAFAVPRRTTAGEPFEIATGEYADDVHAVARAWAGQACSLAGRLDAAVYAGTGDATNETPLKGDTWYQRAAGPHATCGSKAYQQVTCDRCKRTYQCTPTDDFYCAAEGDHCCEPCLLGDMGTAGLIVINPSDN